MARKTIRIEIPNSSPDGMLTILQGIKDKQETEGANSPINGVDMTEFATEVDSAAADRAEAKRLEAEVQTLNMKANRTIGISEGQTSQTEGTLYFEMLQIRDQLLSYYRGNEKELEQWGFKVVIGNASVGRRAVNEETVLNS